MNIFREKFRSVDCRPKNYPHFGHNKNFIKKSHFYPIFNASYQVHFQKNLNRFREKFKSIYFRPKNDPFLLFWGWYEFSLKYQNSLFYPIFSAFYQVEFQKNVMKRFRGKFNSVDFEPKMPHLPHFGYHKNWL